jgi:hemoglobin
MRAVYPFLVVIVALITACQSSATPTTTTPAATPTSVPPTATPTSPPTSTPWPLLSPDANDDRVGFPEGYETDFDTFYVFDRPENKQVRVVYANDAAASARPGEPFPYGSILVMETYRAVQDEQGNVVLDEDGRFQRDDLRGIFVMRKEPGFGTRYQEQRTGEWEYVAFRPDHTYQTEPKDAVRCAACHVGAGLSRDWVYRANLFFAGPSGALPQAPSDQPADQPTIDSYLYLPGTIRIKVGTEVTWHNNDQVPHTITANDGSFSGLVQQGTTFQHTFDTAGTIEYFCAIHPAMMGQVIVEE